MKNANDSLFKVVHGIGVFTLVQLCQQVVLFLQVQQCGLQTIHSVFSRTSEWQTEMLEILHDIVIEVHLQLVCFFAVANWLAINVLRQCLFAHLLRPVLDYQLLLQLVAVLVKKLLAVALAFKF